MREGPIRSVGIDVGGTFTDLYALNPRGGDLIGKAPTTPRNLVVGVMEAIEESGVDLRQVANIAHGSTIATNAVIERNLPPVAFVTTEGFRDLIEIGRYHRKELYDPYQSKPEPLVPRRHRFEVPERVDCEGEMLQPLDEGAARGVAAAILREEIPNVAVGFFNAYANPKHEERFASILTEVDPTLNVALSSRVLPRIRPLGRFITTILNASLEPLIGDYVSRLEGELERAGFGGTLWLIQSNGGITRASEAVKNSEGLLFSGPAAGVVGTASVCADLGTDNAITMDMGGTSCDVSLVEHAAPLTTNETEIAWDMPVPIPMVDLTAIGAGGGSLAWVDEQGVLKVGPESAGADPGPAFYGRGNEQPTVSDADLVLGYLDPDGSLAGGVRIEEAAAHRAMSALGEELGTRDTVEVARGIVTIANQNMGNAIIENLVKRGRDPREFALVAFGGAGPLHAVNVAKTLSIPKVIVPLRSSIFSAYAATLLDVRRELHATYLHEANEADPGALSSAFESLERRGHELLAREGFHSVEVERYVEMRYVGQSYELEVPVRASDPRSIAEDFVSEHERVFGVAIPDNPITFVNLRVSVIGRTEKPTEQRRRPEGQLAEGVHVGQRQVFFVDEERPTLAGVYDGRSLQPGNIVEGPALIEFGNTTALVEPHAEAQASESGHLVISVNGGT